MSWILLAFTAAIVLDSQPSESKKYFDAPKFQSEVICRKAPEWSEHAEICTHNESWIPKESK